MGQASPEAKSFLFGRCPALGTLSTLFALSFTLFTYINTYIVKRTCSIYSNMTKHTCSTTASSPRKVHRPIPNRRYFSLHPILALHLPLPPNPPLQSHPRHVRIRQPHILPLPPLQLQLLRMPDPEPFVKTSLIPSRLSPATSG
jgi:hypothetical protein